MVRLDDCNKVQNNVQNTLKFGQNYKVVIKIGKDTFYIMDWHLERRDVDWEG